MVRRNLLWGLVTDTTSENCASILLLSNRSDCVALPWWPTRWWPAACPCSWVHAQLRLVGRTVSQPFPLRQSVGLSLPILFKKIFFIQILAFPFLSLFNNGFHFIISMNKKYFFKSIPLQKRKWNNMCSIWRNRTSGAKCTQIHQGNDWIRRIYVTRQK